MYGTELILDIHECVSLPLNVQRDVITQFSKELCELMDMVPEDLFFWDYKGDPEGYDQAPPHLKGTTAVQFLKTSNITIHYLADLRRVYLNAFSCKPFDPWKATEFCLRFWGGRVAIEPRILERR